MIARIAIAAGWLAALAALTQWGESPWALPTAIAVTMLAGGLVARWWILLVPAAVALIFIVATLIAGIDQSNEWWDVSPTVYAAAIAIAGVALAFVLAVGVAFGKLLRR